MSTNDFFLLKIGREEYFSEKLIYLFLVLPWICYILFLEKRDWLASRHSSDNRQIQLIEHHCTGLKARASFYKILVSIRVMSPANTVWQAKMDEISPNFCKFPRLVNSRSIKEKIAGGTKNGTFPQITLNIALDMYCFISLIGQLLKKHNYKTRILHLY